MRGVKILPLRVVSLRGSCLLSPRFVSMNRFHYFGFREDTSAEREKLYRRFVATQTLKGELSLHYFRFLETRTSGERGNLFY